VLWLPTALILAELGEAELRRQHPEMTDYFRRTPRYLPRRTRKIEAEQ